MANTYLWVIAQLDCYKEHEGKENVVHTIHWRRKADNGKGVTCDLYDEQAIPFDANKSFTAYDNLTQAQVIGWLESELGAEKIASLKTELDRQIADQIAPSVVAPELPW